MMDFPTVKTPPYWATAIIVLGDTVTNHILEGFTEDEIIDQFNSIKTEEVKSGKMAYLSKIESDFI